MATRPGWDQDSPQLVRNLQECLGHVRDHALARRGLTLLELKGWHRLTLRDLAIDDPAWADYPEADLRGNFRGPPKLKGAEAQIGGRRGTASEQVASECAAFMARLRRVTQALDRLLPAHSLDAMTPADLNAVTELAAWAHNEWVRVHPFANGNGRTARFIGNWVLMRYGLPPVLTPRPRPEGDYSAAAALGMEGRHKPLAQFIVARLTTLP